MYTGIISSTEQSPATNCSMDDPEGHYARLSATVMTYLVESTYKKKRFAVVALDMLAHDHLFPLSWAAIM